MDSAGRVQVYLSSQKILFYEVVFIIIIVLSGILSLFSLMRLSLVEINNISYM